MTRVQKIERDDIVRPTHPQLRIIDRHGDFALLFDIHVIGNKASHSFVIEHSKKRVAVHDNISLAKAKRLFQEAMAAHADNQQQ